MIQRRTRLVVMGAVLSFFPAVMPVHAAEETVAAVPEVAVSTATVDTRTNLEKLSDPDYQVRRNAVIYLGADKKKENVPQLITMLNDANTEVQRAAVSALANSGDGRAVQPLIEKFKGGSNQNIRMSIVIALGDLKASAAVPLLRSELKDPFPPFRNEAIRALGKIKTAATYPDIVGMLNDEAEGVRVMAADVVANLRLSSAVPLLIKNLNDATPVVRRAAAVSLGEIGAAEQALPDLEKLASDKDQSVAAAAQESMTKINAYTAAKQAEKAKAAAKAPMKKKVQ